MKKNCYEFEDGSKICYKCLDKEEVYYECIKCPDRDTCKKICCLPLLPFSKFRTLRDS